MGVMRGFPRLFLLYAVLLLGGLLVVNVTTKATNTGLMQATASSTTSTTGFASFTYDAPVGNIPSFLSGGYDIKQIIVSNYLAGRMHILNVSVVCVDTIGFYGFNVTNPVLDYYGFMNWGNQHKSELSNPQSPLWNIYVTYYAETFSVYFYDPEGNWMASVGLVEPVDGHQKNATQLPFNVQLYAYVNEKNLLGEPKIQNNTFSVAFDITNSSVQQASKVTVASEWQKRGGTLQQITHGNDTQVEFGVADEWGSTNVPIPEFPTVTPTFMLAVAMFAILRIKPFFSSSHRRTEDLV